MAFFPIRRCLPAVLSLFLGLTALSQRNYAGHSVLASGSWFKIGVQETGIYKIDLPFLARLGLNTSNLSSSSLRLFGNGGAMLPESPSGSYIDDLRELAIWVEDGGDGQLNGSDYILFYAEGPHTWIRDSANQRFQHLKNRYSDFSYFYLTVGSNGKRISSQPASGPASLQVNSFQEHYYYERDTFNFLSSGKDWYGEEFSALPGRSLSRQFPVPLNGGTISQAMVTVSAVARSIGSPASLQVSSGGQPLLTLGFPALSNGQYEVFAQTATGSGTAGAGISSSGLTLEYSSSSTGSQCWLDWFEVQARVALQLNPGRQLLFRDWATVGPGNTAAYTISNAASLQQVWDCTDPSAPRILQGNLSGSQYTFTADASRLREFAAFSTSSLLQPEAFGRVTNQDLHGLPHAAYLIIAQDNLKGQAQRLADYHRQQEGLTANVVTVSQVYQEFASGSPDPTALRDFVKMCYDRAGTDSTKRPRYLLLLGDASFDYKSRIRNNTNGVPAWESPQSLDPLSTHVSDDFYGFLDDGDDLNTSTPLLDIGIGRIPANTETEAAAYIDKLIGYALPESIGPWRNEFTFVADDEDQNLHLQDAELITQAAAAVAPVFTMGKIYLDAFPQVGGAGGSRYPEASNASNGRINNGTLIWNYSGHGGFRRLAEEVILDQSIINGFSNTGKLPLFITATCDVAPYDNPLISSIGENLLLRPKTGAIALMTTTRLVFAFSNRIMNKNYLEAALQRKPDGSYPTLGEAVKQAKNTTYAFFGDAINNRKFTLLGDPALRLALPQYQVKTTAVNGRPLQSIPDTLKALATYTVSGSVIDATGNPLPAFNGTVYASVLDKERQQQTLGNDAASPVTTYREQKNLIFRGKAVVENGNFTFSFVVPADIDYRFGKGRISYYVENGKLDGNGVLSDIIVGGTGTGINDNRGPELKAWLNDEKFTEGSITNANPVLLLKLTDSSGINILGSGIGHDLEAVLDGDLQQRFVLNTYYEADPNSFRSGRVRFQLPQLSEGLHTLTIKAWDVLNNSTEIQISFRVVANTEFRLEHVLNYPNPFTTRTQFWFDHNRPGEALRVSIQVYTISGKLVKTLSNTIISNGIRSNEVEWNGRDEYGEKLGRGAYIYHLKVTTPDGRTAQQWEKLYIL